MSKKNKKVLIILGILVVLIIGYVLFMVSFLFYELFIRPENDAISEAKSKASYLLLIPDKSTLKKAGEAGMAETIDNNNHCYTYAFQGTEDFLSIKNTAISLVNKTGYYLEPIITIDTENAYEGRYKASDGWTTKLQVLNNTALVKVYGIIDNPVKTKYMTGQILVSGQVCNI